MRGDSPLNPAVQHIVRILENPVVSAAIGLALGYILFSISKHSFRHVSAGNAEKGVAIAAASLFGRLVVATAALAAYKRLFEPGFKPFALCLAGGFLVLYSVEIVRYSGVLKRRVPAQSHS